MDFGESRYFMFGAVLPLAPNTDTNSRTHPCRTDLKKRYPPPIDFSEQFEPTIKWRHQFMKNSLTYVRIIRLVFCIFIITSMGTLAVGGSGSVRLNPLQSPGTGVFNPFEKYEPFATVGAGVRVTKPGSALIKRHGLFSVSNLFEATITTDQSNYQVGDTVLITGSGFSPFEQVQLQVVHYDPAAGSAAFASLADHTGHDPWWVSADEFGNVSSSWLVDEDSLNDTLLLTADGLTSGLHAEHIFYDGSVGTYDQCSNDDGDGYGTGDLGCRWTNGNLNANNSTYREDEATVQRLWLEGFVPGSQHTLTLEYGTTKGARHAYDFLTTWDHSENWVTPADLCQFPTGASTNTIPGCVAAFPTASKRDIPEDPNVPDETVVNGWEPIDPGDREFVMAGGTIGPFMPGPLPGGDGPSLVSGVYGSGDSETAIRIRFTVGPSGGPMCKGAGLNETCGVMLWFGAHISDTDDWTGPAGDGFGGATSIPGSPYHVQLSKLDGASIGNRDNQMQAGAIVEDGNIIVRKETDPDGSTQLFTFSTSYSADFDLSDGQSNDSGPLAATSEAGTYSISETVPAGWDLTSATCDDGSPIGAIDLGPGETVTCTFNNTIQRGNIIVKKETDPDGSTQSFDFTSSYAPGAFSLTDGQQNDSGPLLPTSEAGTYSVSETVPAGWDLTSATCDDGSPIGAINLQPDETVTCTFNNTQRGHLELTKTVNGVPRPDLSIDFSLYLNGDPGAVPPDLTIPPDVLKQTINILGDADGILVFDPVPPESYTACEFFVAAGFTDSWLVNGVPTPSYNPEANDTVPADTGIRCVDFTIDPGSTVNIAVSNTSPQGDARTIGYWKNWSSCTRGNQAPVLDYVLDSFGGPHVDILNLPTYELMQPYVGVDIGSLHVDTCEKAFEVLSKRFFDSGRKARNAKNPAVNMAAQLLAAKLNIQADADPLCIGPVIDEAQELLIAIGYNGSTTGPISKTQSMRLNELNGLLDDYNNNVLTCPIP